MLVLSATILTRSHSDVDCLAANLAHWNEEKSYTKMPNGKAPPESIRGKLAKWTSSWLASHEDIEARLHGIRTETTEVPEGAEALDEFGNPLVDDDGNPIASAGEKVVERMKTGVPILYHAMPPDPGEGRADTLMNQVSCRRADPD